VSGVPAELHLLDLRHTGNVWHAAAIPDPGVANVVGPLRAVTRDFALGGAGLGLVNPRSGAS